MTPARSIAEVINSGLCIGCGLCEAVTGGWVPMRMTEYGAMRPVVADEFASDEEEKLLSACPGTVAISREAPGLVPDPIWGAMTSAGYAWAGDAEIRHRAATGGVLTALGVHLLKSGRAAFILHLGADPDAPMRSHGVISTTPDSVVANAGSRYGPTTPLAGLEQALVKGKPFAVIAKPCDMGAIHALAKTDPRVDRLIVARLVMVCGGQSRLGKSRDLLDEFGLAEEEVTLFRYRGYGNPGRTRVETQDGRAFEKSYNELWEDETGWQLETRCKMCPDALGEAADIAALDVWPGGGPVGEDAGFNGIVVRNTQAAALVQSAVDAGDLVLGDEITPEMMNDFQPHQVRKKHAFAARMAGRRAAGLPEIATAGLRLDELGDVLDPAASEAEKAGAQRRAETGRMTEPIPGARDT
ncbi:MAG: Coenzyme F420 hydrogenase/dehydrogenase, beta subunit C-terminal domain [Pseudomonadota bacterium]